MVRLTHIAGWGVVLTLAVVIAAEMAKPPTVYVGKIEQTFAPVEFPPAVWRGLKD